ncbi:MAG: hypothetical protein HY268_08050 [Deltaproteobacteria bacterium]|nr:hypothetical protein [Deltaproteobacteria bacterium]
MRCSLQTLCRVGLLLALLLSPEKLAAQDPQGAQFSAAATAQPPAVPELADLVPRVTALSNRLASLEAMIADGVDLGRVKKQLEEISAIIDEHDASQFRALQTSTHEWAGRLPQLRADIKSVDGALAEVSTSVTVQVRILGQLRKEWLAERTQWSAWQTALLKDEPLEEIAATLTKARSIIDAAFALLLRQLKPLLTLQNQAGNLQTRINALTAEVDGLMVLTHGDVSLSPDHPMLSSQYFFELATAVRNGAQTGLAQVSWPGKIFLARHAGIVVLQGMLFLLLVLLFFRHRQQLERAEHWRFVAKRPVAASLLVAAVTGAIFYELPPTMVIFALTVLIGGAFARLWGGLVERGWRQQFGYGVMALLITTNSFYALGLSFPLFRAYLLMAALVSFVCCLRWAVKSRQNSDLPLYAWAFRLGAVLSAVIFFFARLWSAALPYAWGPGMDGAQLLVSQRCACRPQRCGDCPALDLYP